MAVLKAEVMPTDKRKKKYWPELWMEICNRGSKIEEAQE